MVNSSGAQRGGGGVNMDMLEHDPTPEGAVAAPVSQGSDGAEPVPASAGVPGGVWGAVRASPWLVAAAVVVCVAAGVAFGLVRHPKYSATAKLAVLHLNFGAPGGLSGFSGAAAVLADTYARSVDADGVVDPLALQFRTSPGGSAPTCRGRVSRRRRSSRSPR